MNRMPKPGRKLYGLYIISRAGGVFSALFGVLALTGWITGQTLLGSARAEYVPMAPSTALFFIICGLLLSLYSDWTKPKQGYRIAAAFMSIMTAASLLLLILSLLGINPAAEHPGMSVSDLLNGIPVGHMSPLTAVCFILIGTTFLLAFCSPRFVRLRRLIIFFPPLLVLISLVLLISYSAGGAILYRTSMIPPALPTALAFLTAGLSLVSSMMLYVKKIDHELARLVDSVSSSVIGVVVLTLILLVLAANLFFRSYVGVFKESAGTDLMAVANLKVHEIRQWRLERLNDGRFFAENYQLAVDARNYLDDPDNPENFRIIHAWLSDIQAAYKYQNVYLLDPEAGSLLAHFSAPVDKDLLIARSREVAQRGEPAFLDFYRQSPDGPVVLSLLVPLNGGGRSDGTPAVLVMQIDPYQFLYPLVMLWPDSSGTAETLIVRRDGSDAQFLNVLRFNDSPPLRLRFPLSRTSLPATMAVLGREGIMEGIDYREQKVLSALRAIPDSPWFLVARKDSAEVYAPLRRQLYLILEIIGALVIAITGIGVAFWQRKSASHFRQLYQSESAKEQSEERYKTTIQNIREAIITTDSQGLIQIMNPTAEHLSGWTGTLAIGRPLEEIFRIIDEKTREPLTAAAEVWPIRSPSAGGDHSLLISRNGREVPVSYNVTAVSDSDGAVQGRILVFRDHTREREAYRLLAESRELLAATQAVARVGGWEYDFANGKLVWTEETYRLHEVEPDFEVTKENGISFYPDEARIKLEAAVETALQTGERYDLELPLITAKGRRRWVRTAGRPVIKNEKPVRLIGTTQDITDQKEAERELEFRSELLANVGEAVVVRDAAGRIVYWNSGAESTFGWNGAEAVGRNFSRLLLTAQIGEIPPESPSLVPSQRSEESVFRHRDGGEILTLTTETPLLDDAGALQAVISVSRDITARKELEIRYARLFNSIWDSILIANTDREIIDCNDAFSHLFGYELAEIRGQQTHYIYSSIDEFEQMGRELRNHMDDPMFKLIIHYKKKDGSVFRGETSASVLRDYQGRALGFIGLIRDVTERELMDRQLIEFQKMESLGQIAGGIAHDFNNVLMAIGGASQMLGRLDQTGAARQLVNTIISSVKRGNAVTNRMLTFARSVAPETKAVALKSFLAEFSEMSLHALPQNVHLRFSLSDDAPQVLADPAQLQQVLLTLAINAADAMGEGGDIRISVRRPTLQETHVYKALCGEPESCWCLDVSDQGCGMDEETRRRVFEPFFTTKESTKGTGLGLAVVYKIVTMHKGWIDVASSPGEGSTFSIGLPAAAAATAVEEPEEGDIFRQGAGESLLIIDDEDTIRELLSSVLAENGYTTATAETAGEALSLLETESGRLSLIITDIGLPDMNGNDLIVKLRELYPAIPIMAMTGYVDPVLDETLLSSGAGIVMKKPYDLSEMSRCIRNLLS